MYTIDSIVSRWTNVSLSSSRILSSTLYMSVLNLWLSVRANNKIIFWSFNRFLVLSKLLFYVSNIFSTIPNTRSGSIADDSTVPIVNFANQMDNYICKSWRQNTRAYNSFHHIEIKKILFSFATESTYILPNAIFFC